MTCPSCAAALPREARFCPGCGAGVAERSCASCGQPLGAQHRFCASCGAAAPDGPAAAPRTADPAPQSERRVSSVLFADLVGFTPLAESRDPEEVRELLSGYFDRCRDVVARYGGTVEKFIGDAVVAVWGVPVAHEDDAERAVRAGLDLVEAVTDFGERTVGAVLAMRVGVVTGEVAVTLGADREGMVAGDAVNTAARVQAKAAPGAVWVDEQTRALTAAAIGYEPVGAHELKGKSEAVTLFRATAVMGVVGGVGRDFGVEAPLVGRRRELTLVKEVFQAAAEDGRGRLLVVTGGPGVGKTRLGWELQKYIDGLTATVWLHWGRCAAYGDGVAFSALSAAVRRRIGAGDDAPAAEQRERLMTQLDEVVHDAAERDWLAPRLAVLLGGEDTYTHDDLFAAWLTWFERISRGGDPVLWIIDDAHRADDALLDFVEHLAASARFPMLVVLLARQELLDRRPRLAASRRGTVIGLEGLTEAPMGELFDALVVGLPPRVRAELVEGSEGVPLYAVETVRALLDRGLVIEDGGARRLAPGVDAARLADMGAPTSLQMLIASRLDALPAALRELVQYASVLGAAFSLEGLAAVSGRTAQEVAAAAQELAARDLVKRVADRFSPDYGKYAFEQAMVRQVAYRTQSRQARLNRHLAAARYLEGQAETAGELLPVVAQHLSDARTLLPDGDRRAARLTEDLVRWLERSGQRASSLGAADEAMTFYAQAMEHAGASRHRARLAVLAGRAALDAGHTDRGLALASVVADSDPLEMRARAATIRADALRRLGRPEEAWKELEPFLGTVDDLSAASASILLRFSSRAYAELGDTAGGRPLAEQALLKAEESGDPALIGWALNDVSALYYFTGQRRLGVVILDGAIEYCEAHHAVSPLMATLINRAVGTTAFDVREAVRFYERALDHGRLASDAWSAQLTGVALQMAYVINGRWDEDRIAEETDWLIEPLMDELPLFRYLHQALQCLRGYLRGDPDVSFGPVDQDLIDHAPLDMGQEVAAIRLVQARADGGLAQLALEFASAAVDHTNTAGGTTEWYPFLWSCAVGWLLEGGAPEDLAAARRAIAAMEGGQRLEPAILAQLPRLRATLAIREGGPDLDAGAVERDLREAIDLLESYGAVPDRARAQEELGRWLTTTGRAEEGAALQAEAAATMAELGVPARAASGGGTPLARSA
jgi:class 3 adenylate cyclase/tetratricopeptide (TPR) repeat protein